MAHNLSTEPGPLCCADMYGETLLIGYASGNFGKNLVYAGFDVTLLYLLTDLLKIPASAAGQLLAVVFAGDLVFDIAAGYLAGAAASATIYF